jgi:hypothetical protein
MFLSFVIAGLFRRSGAGQEGSNYEDPAAQKTNSTSQQPPRTSENWQNSSQFQTPPPENQKGQGWPKSEMIS